MKGMTKVEMEQYRDKKPIAVYPMGNWGGVEILDIIHGIDDYVIARYNFGEPEKDKLHRVKIKYNKSGTPYIFLDGSYIRVDDMIKL